MKSRVIAFLLSLVMAFSLFPTVALADNTGDPNIEGGGGNTGDSLSRANIWYDHVYLRNPPINDTTPGIGGECGIRISVVTANGYATKATFDCRTFLTTIRPARWRGSISRCSLWHLTSFKHPT